MKLTAHSESWPLAQAFAISRGSRTHAEVVVATLELNGIRARGECTPYPRYGESIPQTLAELEAISQRSRKGEPMEALLSSMPAGAARNALDAAWWDLRCKQAGVRATDLLGRAPLRALTTMYTLGIAAPEAMEAAARAQAHRAILKIKTGSEAVVASIEAVRRGAPDSLLVVDANEAWKEDKLEMLLDAMAERGVTFIEQPLPAGKDERLAKIKRPLPVIADESMHTRTDIAALADRYDGVNLKLDKTGGLTEALAALDAARDHGLTTMCGCMLGTSLAMAPAMLLAQEADYIDLDAPLLLASDRTEGIRYTGSLMHPYPATLWG